MRPRGERAQMIPVVTHVFGVGAIPFVSDVRISNPHAARETATLIFTRSAEDGRTSFSAIDVVLEAGQTAAFDDIVANTFQTAGSGTLEVLGDVLAMSRTYAITARGTMGQQIPPGLDETVAGGGTLRAAPLPGTADRVNLGVSETGGGSGVIRAGDREFTIAPFGQVQFPIDDETVSIRVLSGDARVVAYLSQIDNTTNDPMFIPAVLPRFEMRRAIAPAISARGAIGSEWRTDVWSTDGAPLELDAIGDGRIVRLPSREGVLEDVLAGVFSIAALRVVPQPGSSVMARIRNGGMSQFVPFLDIEAPPAEQQLLFIESVEPYRTNIGIVADAPVFAEVSIYDAAGNEVARTPLSTGGGVAQLQVTQRVVNGRATVRFVGRGRAYASLVDNRTGDATFVAGR
jgi:hypothetical protein